MTIDEQYQSIRPVQRQRIYDLVKNAGVDVRFWEESKRTGKEIDPYRNIYQNSRWTFGGGDQPLVACIWWTEIVSDEDRIMRASSSKLDVTRMSTHLAERKGKDGSASTRLRIKIGKAQAFDRLVSEAYRKRKPVRVVVLDGRRADDDEEATEASVAERRLLDPQPWFVHEYNPFLGDYQLVRNIPAPPTVVEDPFGNAADPADDLAFRELLDADALTDTEKDAVIKARVGQGYFREALIARWRGCSVTNCTDTSLLVASHIKPWRDCLTRVERLSPDNGLLLTPSLDRLFDRGLITFDEEQRYNIIISKALKHVERQVFGSLPTTRVKPHSYEGMKPFMKYHRENIFLDNRPNEVCVASPHDSKSS